MNYLQHTIESQQHCKIIFTDLFDTLIHRTVHPNYTLKLWAKHLVRELGLSVDSAFLYSVRAEALSFLSRKQGLRSIEVNYSEVITEVYKRLVNTNLLINVTYNSFERVFQKADYEAEISVQFRNENLLAKLYRFKEKGYRIYLISDFYLSDTLISKVLDYHEISSLFNAIFVSSSLGKSKENGNMYPYVLDATATDPETAIMIGDNKKSDFKQARKQGIHSIHLKHLSHKIRNKQNLFGNDSRHFKALCKSVELECKRSPHPFSEYILHFYFFTERLYLKAKKDGITNLFFLAREGLYLKRLFDAFQEMNHFTDGTGIQTHYLKISRHSARQVALRSLDEEDFSAFKGEAGNMSVLQFLEGFRFSEVIIDCILDELGELSKDEETANFFNSDVLLQLRSNTTFTTEYEKYRRNQTSAFNRYLDSFAVDFESEGLHLVDIGWGGTMQENLYYYLDKKISVTGYYLGLKEVYDIQPETKRYGLNFSVYPNCTYSDDVLKANGQLYEQLLSASHGSTVGYSTDKKDAFAITFHEASEKEVFEKWIRPVQEYMFVQFKILFERLRPLDYDQDLAQQYMTNMALRTGILGKKKNVEFVDGLSRGFYQNVGQNKVGVTYSPDQLKVSKLALLSVFIKSPEKMFRYLVKIKPYMYAKGMYWMSAPLNLTYYYIKFNFWFKKKWLGKGLIS